MDDDTNSHILHLFAIRYFCNVADGKNSLLVIILLLSGMKKMCKSIS